MEVTANGFEWLVHSTDMFPVGTEVGIRVDPFDIQIMNKLLRKMRRRYPSMSKPVKKNTMPKAPWPHNRLMAAPYLFWSAAFIIIRCA